MKKTISTIVVVGLVSSLLASSAYAGDHFPRILNPLWLPVAVMSSVAATVATIASPPVVYERPVYAAPPVRTVIYEEPREYHYNYHYAPAPPPPPYYDGYHHHGHRW